MEFEIFGKFISYGLGIMGLYYRIKAMKSKRLIFEKAYYNVSEDNEYYQYNNIENIEKRRKVAISEVVIWNSGNVEILNIDMPKKNKLNIYAGCNSKIYEAKIKFNNDPDNTIDLKIDENKVFIDLDFIDKKKGFIVEIVHNSRADSEINVSGRIIGGSSFERLFDISRNSKSVEHWSHNLLAFVFGAFLITISYFGAKNVFLQYLLAVMLAITGALFMLIAVIKVINNKMPKDLKNEFYRNKLISSEGME